MLTVTSIGKLDGGSTNNIYCLFGISPYQRFMQITEISYSNTDNNDDYITSIVCPTPAAQYEEEIITLQLIIMDDDRNPI